jgi:hypothetical protein
VLISISDPGSHAPRLQASAWVDVLSVEFHDVGHAEQDMAVIIGAGYVLPLLEHAEAIIDFVCRHAKRNIIAHCEAGLSRSSAVCAFLRYHGWRYIYAGQGLELANPLLLALLRQASAANSKLGGRGAFTE